MVFGDSSVASYPESELRRGQQSVWLGLETKYDRDLKNEFEVVCVNVQPIRVRSA